MIEQIKSNNNIKLFVSMFVFALSGLFFINSSPPPVAGGFCKDCGSYDNCYEGSDIDAGWEDCNPSAGWPACEVSGEYGACGGPGQVE